VRNKSVDENLLDRLNCRHDPLFEPEEGDFYIYLTTTNAKVDVVNDYNLERLPGNKFVSEAEITGDFDLKSVPVALNLNLKAGSQIMLANNTKSKRRVNPNEIGEMEYLGKSFLGFSGFDNLRQEERVFRVDRILEIDIAN